MVNQTILIIYENYSEEMRKAASAEACHFGGLSRIITGKRSNTENILPTFDARLELELNQLFGEQSDSAEVRELAEWMLDKAFDNRNEPQIKYSFMAVQRHLIPLINCLNSADATFLIDKFESAVPRRERFPVQKTLLTKLKEQSKR